MEDMKDLIMAALNGEAESITPEQLMLDSYRMTSETIVNKEVFLYRYFGKACFPRREITTITGPAKSGKTFFTTMVMAAAVKPQMVLERIRDEPLRVMWYDTEQSRNTTKEIMMERIGRMVGASPDPSEGGEKFPPSTGASEGGEGCPDEQFFVFNVRSASIQERRELLGVAIATHRPDIVILDGISDLLIDINDGPRTVELMEELAHLAEEYDCNITAIIHLNRTGEKSNLRGWLGSVMLQKSYEVFNCTQVGQTETLSVEHSVSRKGRCLQTLYYEIDDNGIPYSTEKPDIQPRDERGRWTKTENVGGAAGSDESLNSDYIIRHPDNVDKTWEWDLRRLFTDAMGDLPSMGSEQMGQAVMRLSRIKQKQYYYKVVNEAERQGVIMKANDRYGRVVFIIKPPR